MRKLLATALLSALALASGCASIPAPPAFGDAYGLSPYWHWKTIDTAHFRISFPENLEAIARKAAAYYEEANSVYTKTLYWEPPHKVQVLVIDNSDEGNGLTTPLARFGMVLWVTPPDDWFSTAYYDDWLRLLVFHEYTHFMNMDATRGVFQAARYIFGDVTLPNAAWPSWMLEGLAVYDETRFTHSGRGRSSYYEMILRTAVAEGVFDTSAFVPADRLDGPSPYFPDGENAYLFGYSLMAHVARSAQQGEDALGLLSLASSERMPYFNNDTLKDVIGHDWYAEWDDWVAETRARAGLELERIRSKPVSPVVFLGAHEAERAKDDFDALGSAVSPDGRWLAYTWESVDRRQGLYLVDLKADPRALKPVRLEDKYAGARLAFTPDSRALIYSTIERRSKYYLFSDLHAYDLERGSEERLTEALRAKDPDVSPDGKQVAFTVVSAGVTSLAVAPLERNASGRLSVGAVRTLYEPPLYDHVGEARFSADGRALYFSIHRNGRFSEEICAADIATGRVRTLVDNGHFNRFPALGPDGALYFVSDLTGVDDLYRFREKGPPEMLTNLVSGMRFPTFAPGGTLYASIFATDGWRLGVVEPAASSSAPLTLAAWPFPAADARSSPQNGATEMRVGDYSAWPTLLPRAWAPLFSVDPGGFFFGAAVEGFDATDRHRYLAQIGYENQFDAVSWDVLYYNRSLGPVIGVLLDQDVTNAQYASTGNSLVSDTREAGAAVSVSFPIQWTYSTLTPTVGATAFRSFTYTPGGGNPSAAAWVPSAYALLSFTNAESTALAVAPEEGRLTAFGTQVYADSGAPIVKLFARDQEYLRLFGSHWVLVPSISAQWVSSASPDDPSALALVKGRQFNVINPFPSIGLSQLVARGYAFDTFEPRAATVASLDLVYPILRIFRGLGLDPIYFENFYGVVFGETTLFPYGEYGYFAPSAGAGLRFTTYFLFEVPVTLGFDYQYGFRTDLRGGSDYVLSVTSSLPSF